VAEEMPWRGVRPAATAEVSLMRPTTSLLWIPMLLVVGLGAADVGAKTILLDVEITGSRLGGPTIENVRVWIGDRRVRIEAATKGEQKGPHVIIYRGDRDRFYSIAPGRKAYIEVNRDLIAATGPEMKAARREVDGQMSRLPEDQRLALERLIGVRQMKKGEIFNPLAITRSPGTSRVGEFECGNRDIWRGKRKVGEMCVVSWDEIGIYQEDLDVFRQLANFQRELMGARDLTPLEVVPNQPLDVLVQFDGFPLYLKKLREGEYVSEIRVVSASRVANDESLFEVPAGYRGVSAFEVFMNGGTVPATPAPAGP
jgi:hypothetical protein